MLSAFWSSLQSSRFYPLILAISCGVLFSISWYKPFTFVAFIAFVPLFLLEAHIANENYKFPKWALFFYTFLAFVTWNIGVYWWLWNASGFMTLAAWGANSALMALPVITFHIIKNASDHKFGYLAFAACWIGFEYLHLHWDLSWVWLNIGNIFANTPSWVQWYEYTGAFGGALWILLGNITAYYVLFYKRMKVRLALVLFLPVLISLGIYFTYEEKGEDIEVVVVQPNFDCYTEKFSYNSKTGERNQPTHIPYEQQVERMLKLTAESISPNTKFVAWPETALHKSMTERQVMQNPQILKINDFFGKYENASLVTGIDTYEIYGKNKVSQTKRKHPSIGYYDPFNTAMLMDGESSPEFYRKSKLVIGAETVPFPNVLGAAIINFGGTAGGLGRQAEAEAFFGMDSVATAPLICYESVYGEYVAEFVEKGANFLMVITNDGWWEDTPGYSQHFAYARLRAIETRKSIARSANTGTSGFINQKGDVIQASNYDEMIALRGTIKQNDYQTWYVKTGDYIGRFAAFFAVFMLFSSLVKKTVTIPKKSSKKKKVVEN